MLGSVRNARRHFGAKSRPCRTVCGRHENRVFQSVEVNRILKNLKRERQTPLSFHNINLPLRFQNIVCGTIEKSAHFCKRDERGHNSSRKVLRNGRFRYAYCFCKFAFRFSRQFDFLFQSFADSRFKIVHLSPNNMFFLASYY